MAETASLYLNDDAPLRFDAEVVRRAAADHVKESSGHQAGNRSKFVEDMVEERLKSRSGRSREGVVGAPGGKSLEVCRGHG